MYNDLFTVFGLTVHTYGLMIGIGFLLAVVLGSLYVKKRGENSDLVFNIAMMALLIGFLGGKLLYVIVEFPTFLKDPLSVLGSSGFVVYGGIVTGFLSTYIYSRVKKWDYLKYCDMLTPFVALAQGFGRIGCFFAGCCFGKPTDSIFGVTFPAGSIAPSGTPLWPTQLFSAGGDFIMCIGLLLLADKWKHKGDGGAAYLLAYAVGRFIIECFRGDPRGEVGALSTSQFLSFFLAAIAIAMFIFNARRKPKEAVAEIKPMTEEKK